MKLKLKQPFFLLATLTLLIFYIIQPNEAIAESNLSLKENDLTFWKVKPNSSVKDAINEIIINYPYLEFSQGENNFYTGYSTPQMAYFLDFTYDNNDRVVGLLYEQFKEEHVGLNFKTSKGIGIGSSIQDVFNEYGNNYDETITKEPIYTYLNLQYPVLLSETNQSGTITFKLRYKKENLVKNHLQKSMDLNIYLRPLKITK